MIDLETYASKTGISVSEIESKSRKKETVTARHVYWFYLKSKGFGYNEIARMFNRNHATVFHGINKIRDFIELKDCYVERYLRAIEDAPF